MSTPTSPLREQDIVLASGCSGALDLALSAMLNEGDNLLIPQPAFALYQTLAASKGCEVREYRLLPERQWEADLQHLESLIDSRTRVRGGRARGGVRCSWTADEGEGCYLGR